MSRIIGIIMRVGGSGPDREWFRKRALESVVAQNYPTCYIVLVLDGCKPEPIWEDLPVPVQVVHIERGGSAKAWLAGARASSGADLYITLDDDDQLVEGALQRLNEAWDKLDPTPDFAVNVQCYKQRHYLKADGSISKIHPRKLLDASKKLKDLTKDPFSSGCWLPWSCAMSWTQRAIDIPQLDPFLSDELTGLSEDWDFALQTIDAGLQGAIIQEPIYVVSNVVARGRASHFHLSRRDAHLGRVPRSMTHLYNKYPEPALERKRAGLVGYLYYRTYLSKDLPPLPDVEAYIAKHRPKKRGKKR